MTTLAIYLQTANNLDLTDDQKHILQSFTIDRRLKKAESIKAHLESDDYMLKKVSFQMKHAEFGKIHKINTFNGRDSDVARTEETALHLIETALRGVEKLIVFDEDFTLPFILKRAMLTGYSSSLRDVIYSHSLTVVDIKHLWARKNKEYTPMTLSQLSKYLNVQITAMNESEMVYEIYKMMQGYLCG